MQLFNKPDFPDRNNIAWLGALTLFFSYAELFIPRILPFFRLGLANIPVLAGLSLSPLSFVFLLFIKAFCSSMMAGTLFSPFFLVSLLQSIGSGMAMYVLYNLNGMIKIGTKSKRLVSIYGISVFGSAVSAIIQIACCYIYLGIGTVSLLGPMLLFSIFSGILTAFLLVVLKLPEKAPVLIQKNNQETVVENKIWRNILALVKIVVLFAGAIFIFTLDSWRILLPVMILCLVLQLISGRKILFLPYFTMWVFIIISCLLVPQGKILYSFWKIKITYGALMEGLNKAMILTSVAALSQCMVSIRFERQDSFISQVLCYYQGMRKHFEQSEGNIFERLTYTLSAREL